MLVVLLVACAFLWPGQREDVLDVPTAGRAVAPTGVLSGRLTADRTGRLVCFAVRDDTGSAVLVLPAGYAAAHDRGLLDPAGGVVALPGDDMRATGRPSDVRDVGVDGCAVTGRVRVVSTIRTS